mgnify:CR=1 FL=1
MAELLLHEDNSDENSYNPYNHINKEISLIELQSILRSYGLPTTVHNIDYYRLAFVHRSYTINNIEDCSFECPPNCVELKSKSNERLEFLGDGILEAIIKFYLYKRFPDENEGFMTEKKIALVKNESIGKLAYDMKLNKWLLLSVSAEEKKNRSNYKKLGCLFEAFLGALFLDFNKIDINDEANWFKNVFVTGPGFQIAQIFVESIFEKHVDWMKLIQNDDNYKNILQVILQKAFQVTPIYREITEWDEETGYHMGVYLCLNIKSHQFTPQDDNIKTIDTFGSFDNLKLAWLHRDNKWDNGLVVFLSESKHKIKKKAEQAACKLAIDSLK